jgi:hypothetical protein
MYTFPSLLYFFFGRELANILSDARLRQRLRKLRADVRRLPMCTARLAYTFVKQHIKEGSSGGPGE